MKEGEEIKQNRKQKPYRHRQECGDCQKERREGEVEKGEEGINRDQRRLTLGGGHTIQFTHDVS